MSKIFVFAFQQGQANGGFGDLRQILETDNADGIAVLDSAGLVRLDSVARLLATVSQEDCLELLHLDEASRPVIAERWAQRAPRKTDVSVTDPTGRPFVRVGVNRELLRRG